MKKVFFTVLFLLSALFISASAEVELEDYSFFERESGFSVSFAKADPEKTDEFGILCGTSTENLCIGEEGVKKYPGKLIGADGSFGIILKDPGRLLGDEYYVRAYSIFNEEISYSANIRKINMSVLKITADKLSEALKTAAPGDEIEITDGEIPDFDIDISVSGSSYNPIKIRSTNKGSTVFTGDTNITVSGSYIELSGFKFQNCLSETPLIRFDNSRGSRVSECMFVNSGSSILPTNKLILISNGSKKCRVDNNAFEDVLAIAVGVEATGATGASDLCSDNRIDHNYFLNIAAVSERFPGYSNGFECIQAGTEYRDGISLNTLIEYNRFENVTGDGSEIISNKSNGNIIRYNTFLNCNSGLTLRTGNRCTVSGNFFFNVSAGIIAYGSEHIISDNYMYNSTGIHLNCGNSTESIWGDYKAPSDITISGNTLIYPKKAGIILGRYFSTDNMRTLLPKNILVENNLFVLNNSPAVIDYTGVSGMFYENNQFDSRGAAATGSGGEDGFEQTSVTLSFDGDIYSYNGLSISKDGYIRLPDEIWWRRLVSQTTDVIDKTEPEEAPSLYTAASSQYYISCGETVDIRGIAGNAEYADGEIYSIPADKIDFSFSQGSTDSTLDGYYLTGMSKLDNTYSAVVTSEYKGVSSKTKFYVAPDIRDENDEIAYTSSSVMPLFSYNGKASYWQRENGVLSNTVSYSYDIGVILQDSYTDYDYLFSADIVLTPNGDSEPDVKIYFGFENLPQLKYYYLRLGKEQGIYGREGKIGELTADIKSDMLTNIKIAVKNGVAAVTVDGNAAGAADISLSPYGKFGFAVCDTLMSAANISIKHNSIASGEPSELAMTARAVDSNAALISFPDSSEAALIRIYKDGEYIAQVNGSEEYCDVNVIIGKTYEYTARVYDSGGNRLSEGSCTFSVSEEEANSFFRIDNLKVRAGADGEYIEEYYSHRNMFLREGLYPYKDRTYSYTSVPSGLVNCGYIKTCNSDRTKEAYQNGCDDWITFTLNRSATVYVTFKAVDSIPGWLSEWTKESSLSLGISDQPVSENVYSYHFEVNDNSLTTVKIGAIPSLSAMYQVIVKPDVMPQEIELINYSPTIL